MNPTQNPAGWDTVSRVYNHIELLTLPLARNVVDRVQSQSDLNGQGTTAFDNGCGTGVLTVALKEKFPSLPILATDASSVMVEKVNRRVEEHGWKDIKRQTLDARDLSDIADNSFSHTFSTFMVYLAPDPNKIVQEMYRVTKPGGVLGLAVWGEPYFLFFNSPWTEACRTLIPDYQSVMVMGKSWTQMEDVKAGLLRVGFRDVDAREEKAIWRWKNVQDLSKYFFEGGNPGNDMIIDSFGAKGGNVEEARRLFDRIVEREYGKEDGSIEGHVLACLATARK